MTPRTLDDRLLELGFAPADADRTHRLHDVVADAFTAFAGGQADQTWWIPGRLELFGKHTDYCGGHSLVGTVPRGFVGLVRPRPDERVRLLDARRGDRVEIDPPAEGSADAAAAIESITGWRRYAHVAVRRLRRNFPGAALGADLVFASDLPSASGMSSSSALVVGIVNALVERGGLRERREWRENVRTDTDFAGYLACFENGLSFGSLAGDGGVGTHGGSEDHVAIVCGAARELSLWQFVPIRGAGRAVLPPAWTVVIAASGVAARKIGAAREQYNSLSQRARALLDLWNGHEQPQPSLSAAVGSDPTAYDRLVALTGTQAAQQDELRRRLEQFVREDRRAVAALEAIRSADATRIGELAAASQSDAESRLGNQVPETIALPRLARAHGAFAASSFGAGFGGSAWALVHDDEAARFAARWLAAYQSEFPQRTDAATFIAPPGPPLARLQ